MSVKRGVRGVFWAPEHAQMYVPVRDEDPLCVCRWRRRLVPVAVAIANAVRCHAQTEAKRSKINLN
jgi:hypothetical protein